jgi:hypothetical protein
MTRTPIRLQDLRRSLYVKAKAEPTWRFWGLYVHVCKMETLQEAYRMAKKNDGAPGMDGVTFAAIEEGGRESLLADSGRTGPAHVSRFRRQLLILLVLRESVSWPRSVRYTLLNLFHAAAEAAADGRQLVPDSVLKIRDQADVRKLHQARKLLEEFFAREGKERARMP